jgi:U3 small nucleolar RNA-associated protein 23
MRRKKHKHTRRAVQFYKINFGFREPFKVLLDGNFVHAMVQARMTEASELTGKLLGASVRLFTTRCVMHEVKSLGTEYADTYKACKKIQLYACEHEGNPVVPGDCIQSLVGDSNREHFFVGTQDSKLRARLAKVPGGASLFVSVNGIHLEQPSQLHQQTADQAEASVQHVPKAELKSDALQELSEIAAQRRKQEANLSIFRKSKAKGPNPLAVRKKTKVKQQTKGTKTGGSTSEQGNDGTGTAQHKRTRKRKKPLNGDVVAE